MRRDAIDLAGNKFGKWLVVNEGPKARNRKWLCRCECGAEQMVFGAHLRHGRSTQCRSCASTQTSTKHGLSRDPIHNIWQGIVSRCHNENDKYYPRYGGRGIVVDDRWRDDSNAFMRDMGERPSIHHTTERIDNDGPYSPDNCKWGTKREQAGNRRNNRWIECNGRRMILADWVRELGWSETHLVRRIKNMPLKDALTKKPER